MVYQIINSVVAIEVDEEYVPKIIEPLMVQNGFENINGQRVNNFMQHPLPTLKPSTPEKE